MAVGEQEVEHEPVRALAVLQHVPASRVSVVVNILVTLISAFTKRVTVSGVNHHYQFTGLASICATVPGTVLHIVVYTFFISFTSRFRESL